MQNKLFNQDTLKRPTLGLQLMLPQFPYLSKREARFGFQLPAVAEFQQACIIVTFQVEINLLPGAGC